MPPEATSAPSATPKLTEAEVEDLKQEQKKVVEQAKKNEVAAEKAVANKVVTSSVEKSEPIPDGFPVLNVPIIPGAQIIASSKSGNTYAMTIKVNIPVEDAYNHYFNLYDAIGSARITSQIANKSLSVDMSKKGLKMEFTFESDGENSSNVTMNVTDLS